MEFNYDNKILKRKIKGVEYFRPSHYIDYDDIKVRYVGLLIETNDEIELNQILDLKSIRQNAKIYKD